MSTRINLGDSIHGERIICQGRKIPKPQLIRMTDTHKGSQIKLTGNAFCTIDKPYVRKS